MKTQRHVSVVSTPGHGSTFTVAVVVDAPEWAAETIPAAANAA